MKLPRAKDSNDQFELRLAPMIDVVFLLLVFFVCTASFRKPDELLSANLAPGSLSETEMESSLEPDEQPLVLRVKATDDGIRFLVQEEEYADSAVLADRLSQAVDRDRSPPAIIDVDGDVTVGDVVTAYDVCRRAGLDHISFAASTTGNVDKD